MSYLDTVHSDLALLHPTMKRSVSETPMGQGNRPTLHALGVHARIPVCGSWFASYILAWLPRYLSFEK
jgi:hypothetical protein